MTEAFRYKDDLWKVCVYPDRIELYVDANKHWTWIKDIEVNHCRTAEEAIAIAKEEINEFKQYKERA